MSKEKDISILEYKIAKLQTKITNFEKYSINEKKLEVLQNKLLKYETQLSYLQSY